MPKPAQPTQAQLERPVCAEITGYHVCVLLKGHDGKHVSSKGRVW